MHDWSARTTDELLGEMVLSPRIEQLVDEEDAS
jgi:hypothetical protein